MKFKFLCKFIINKLTSGIDIKLSKLFDFKHLKHQAIKLMFNFNTFNVLFSTVNLAIQFTFHPIHGSIFFCLFL